MTYREREMLANLDIDQLLVRSRMVIRRIGHSPSDPDAMAEHEAVCEECTRRGELGTTCWRLAMLMVERERKSSGQA